MARRAHFWCLVVVIAAAPAPLGSNRPLAWSMLALAVGLLCLSWPLVVPGRAPNEDCGREAILPRGLVWPMAATVCVIAWAWAQSLDAAPDWAAASVWPDAARALALAGEQLPAFAVSCDPAATRTGVMRLLCYAGVAWLAAGHARLSHRPARLVDAVALIGVAYAGYGLAEYASGGETILGMAKWAYRGDLTSTFVNRNNYASYAGLGLLCCVLAAARRIDAARTPARHLALHLRRPAALFALGALACLLALTQTGSRAGTTASLLGLSSLILGLAIARGRVAPRHGALLLGAFAALVAGLAAWLLVLSKVFADNAFDRAIVYQLTLSAIARRPWLGGGLGTFAEIFAGLRPSSLVLPWREAHDTYLELALELGVPATLGLLGAVAGLVWRCLRSILRQGPRADLAAIGLATTVVVATHALVDFSAQIPAVAITWLALLGAAAAAGKSPPAARPPESRPQTNGIHGVTG